MCEMSEVLDTHTKALAQNRRGWKSRSLGLGNLGILLRRCVRFDKMTIDQVTYRTENKNKLRKSNGKAKLRVQTLPLGASKNLV